jgi:hypothetical protein
MVYQSALHYTTWDDGLDLATSMRAFPSQFPRLICYWGWAGSAARSRAQTRGAAVLVRLWLKWGGHDAVVHKSLPVLVAGWVRRDTGPTTAYTRAGDLASSTGRVQ